MLVHFKVITLYSQAIFSCHDFLRTHTNTYLVYGAAYLGQTYFKINPLHAALFSLGTLSAHHLCLKLVNSGNNFPRRATILLVETVTANLAIQCRIFSPLQAIAVIGLTTLCYDAFKQLRFMFSRYYDKF